MPNKYDEVMSQFSFSYLFKAHPRRKRSDNVRKDSANPVEESHLVEFENHLGHRLPPDYREFLQQYGDAIFNSDITSSDGAGPKHFYGLRKNSSKRLWSEWPVQTEGIPLHCLIIGRKTDDDEIAISLYGADQGCLYTRCTNWTNWDEAKGEFEPLELIAESFDEYMRGLRIREETDDEALFEEDETPSPYAGWPHPYFRACRNPNALAHALALWLRDGRHFDPEGEYWTADVAVPLLKDLLEQSDPQLSYFAIQLLSQFGPKAEAAIPAIQPFLFDGNDELRTVAEEALSAIAR